MALKQEPYFLKVKRIMLKILKIFSLAFFFPRIKNYIKILFNSTVINK